MTHPTVLPPDTGQRCGYVAIIGAPNAGKSTLLNTLLGHKLSIVSPKPQTTRGPVRAVLQESETQMIFVDTAGIFAAKPEFEKAMVDSAWAGAQDADAILLVLDAKRGLDADTTAIVEGLKARGKPAILVLNKVDIVEKPTLLALSVQLHAMFDFARTFMISAVKAKGVKDILPYLAAHMPAGPWLYPPDHMTDISERMLAAELTRESCFHMLQAELPYFLMVETEKWEESEKAGNREIRIQQVILVERESHKKIILGEKGQRLKAIGSNARYKIGEALGAKVHLFLFIKISPGWKDKEDAYRHAGL